MDLLNKKISVLNWIEARFTIKDLRHIQQMGHSLNDDQLKLLFKKKESLNELHKLLDNLYHVLKTGSQLLCCLDQDYPAELKSQLHFPTPLMYRGQLRFDHFNLSVVGSRRPNSSSLSWLKDEFYLSLLDLKNKGCSVNVMSGGAYGIDQQSHQVSLLSSTPTTCFLPSGINEFYPANIGPMVQQIEDEGGAVISPFPPHHPIFRSNFYYRNKILVLLSDLVFVVEARRRSGTMMTANLAAKLGKQVVVLPQGPEASCLGGLDLISAGAPMVKCKSDFLFQMSQTSRWRGVQGSFEL